MSMKTFYAQATEKNAFSALLILVCLMLLYAPAVDNSFQYDDRHSIVENPHLRSLDNWPAFFVDPTLFSRDADKAMYRPLVLLSLALNYAWSGYKPHSYHWFNLGIHALCSLLVWGVLLRLGRPPWMALMGGLFFALHPLCAEPVNYISSRSELLAGLGCLSALWFYMGSVQEANRRFYVLSLVCFALGLLSKSIAIMALLWPAVWDWQRSRTFRWSAYAPFAGIAFFYLWGVRQFIERAVLSEPVRTMGEQVATQLKGLVYYAYLLWAPFSLSVDHAFYTSTLGDPLVILAALALTSALAILQVWRGELLGLAVGIGALLPTLIVPLNVLVNEHRLYLSVAGFVFAVTSIRGLGRIRGTGWLATLLLLGLAGLVVQRNGAWRNEVSLWSDAHEKNTRAVRPLLYMGNAERARGNIDQAVRAYAKALEIEPENAVVRAGMGNALMDLGRVDLATTAFRKALEAQPLMTDLNYSLGRALQAGGQLAEARNSYARLPVESPHRAVALNNIGTTFEQGGQPDSAMYYYERAARGNAPDGVRNLNRLVVRFVKRAEEALRAGDYAQVEHSARRALRGSPRHRYGRFFLSVSLLSQGRLKESIRENERLLSDHPDFDEGWLQLANAYETAGDSDRALTAYNQLVERASDPALRSLAKERRARLLGEQGDS
tara:strand:- start:9935 stop:11929 length:1995 start_codon:yes stop_codon:yes gene_type:complete